MRLTYPGFRTMGKFCKPMCFILYHIPTPPLPLPLAQRGACKRLGRRSEQGHCGAVRLASPPQGDPPALAIQPLPTVPALEPSGL